MAKRMFFMFAVAAAIIAGLAYFKLRQVQAAVKAGSSFQPPPAAITTTVAKQETWPSTLSVVGTMTAIHGVTVSADLPGTVDQIKFDSGKSLPAGGVLLSRDTHPPPPHLAP